MSYCKSFWIVPAAGAALVAAALQQPADAIAAPAISVTAQLTRPGAAKPYFTAGTLTARSTAKPEAIARAYLATKPSVVANVDVAQLTTDRVATLKRGHLVRMQQRYQGIVVRGGETFVRTDAEGRVRWVASGAHAFPADFSVKPKVSARTAIENTAALSGYNADEAAKLDVRRATLVIFAPPAAQPRLAYQVRLPNDLQRLQGIRAYVDAETGRVLLSQNLVMRQADGGAEDAAVPDLPVCPDGAFLAYLYEENPVDTEDLICKSLDDYLDAEATALVNADVAVVNCIDNKNCFEITIPGVGLVNVYFCDQIPAATTNADGDFTDYWFVSDNEPEDEFAEVQMFYHVNKVYAVARSLGGFTDLNEKPLAAMVNFRMPPIDFGSICTGTTYTGTASLAPVDQAVFASADAFVPGFPPTDMIVFGQGTTTDFSYDGDVVYHEFGHAVMYTVSPTLSGGFIDQYGFNPTPGGLHEGYADLMTMFVTNDPEVGEYALSPFPGAIRDMENSSTCPEDLVGELHEDAIPFTGAVWEARVAVATTPEERTTFDEALFAAQQGLGTFDNFQTVAAKIVAEVELAFDSTAAGTVQGVLDNRGLNGCNNRVLDGSLTKPWIYVTGTDVAQGPEVIPGPMQHRYELADDSVSLSISIASSQGGGMAVPGQPAAAPALKLVLKGGGDAITWTESGANYTGDYTHEADITIAADGARAGTGTIDVSLPAGTYHVQIVNEGPTWSLNDVSFSNTPGDITPDAGPAPDADTGADDDDGGGCGCVVDARGDDAGATRGGIALGLLGFLAVAWARRRRRD